MRSKFKWIFTLIVAFVMQFSFAQEKTVSGIVSDAVGPLPGANVVVKGTNKGTTTNFDGAYTLRASQGDVLIISYVGMEDQSVTIGSSAIYDVTLQTGVELKEVVVLGYGIEKGKNEITGNVVKLDKDAIEKSSFVSVDQAMQGKVSGLVMATSSGTPGSVQDVRIRGIQSLDASNSPLYVIDGVPVVNGNLSGSANVSSVSPLASIAPSDIESITVLKDAAATSVYGARGTAGVIIVTTKRGKKGDAVFNFSAKVGFMNNSSKGLTPLNGAQKQELFEEAIYNSFGNAIGDPADTYAFIEGAGVAPDLINWNNTGRLDYNWADAVTNKDAQIADYSLSVSSGNEKNTFYATLGLNNTENTTIGSDYKRVNGAIRFDSQLSKKLKLFTSLTGSNSIQNGVLEGGAFFSNPNLSKYFLSPWIKIYNEDGTPSIGDEFTDYTSLHNPVFTANTNIRRNEVTRALVNTRLEYELIKDLKFTTLVGLDYLLSTYKSYNSPLNGDGAATNGSVQENVDRNFNVVFQNSLDYTFRVDEKHKVSLKALIEYQKNKDNFLQAYGENLPNTYFNQLASVSANEDTFGSFTDWSSRSYLGMVNYSYDNKYLLDFSYRYEGNSRFIESERFGSFYSIGLAWNLHEEGFVKEKMPFFDTLRIRGSHGLTGNSGIGLNEYQALVSYDNNYNNSSAAYASSYGSSVGWENAVKNDVGLDFGLFNNRLLGSFAYFSNKTYDMLLNVPLTLTSGISVDDVRTNIGEMTNKGFEIELSYDIIRNDDLNWNISGNYTNLKNEVTKLSPLVPEILTGTRKTAPGHTAQEWFMPTWAGVDPANGDPLWYVNGVDGATTNIYADAERVYQGANALPTYSGGVSTSVSYKGFFLDGSIYFSGGNKIYEDWAGYTQTSRASRFGGFNATTEIYGRWQQPGDIATHPRLEWNNTIINNATNTSTRFLYDGDFIRLRDVGIGYNFPSKFLEGTGLSGVQLAVRGNNLYTWVKDDRLKYDPEVRADGFTRLSTPPTKTVMFQLNVKF